MTHNVYEVILRRSTDVNKHRIKFVLVGALDVEPALADKLLQEVDSKGHAIVFVGTNEECKSARGYLYLFGIPCEVRSI